MAVVRELITKLGFQLDDKPLNKMEAGIERIKTAAKAFVAVFAVGKVFSFLEHASSQFDEIGKAAARLGVSTDTIQKLGYVAKMADVDLGSLQRSLGFLAKNLDAAKKGSDDTAGAFKKVLGNVDLNQYKTADDLFIALSDGFSKMPDGLEKTALGFKIFGKSFQENLPLINQGSAAIRAQFEEAELLNVVLGEDAVKAGQAFDDNLKRMRSFLEAIGLAIASKVFPFVNKIIDSFIEWAKINRDLIRTAIDDWMYILVEGVQALWNVVKLVVDVIRFLYNGLDRLTKALTTTDAGAKRLKLAILAIGAAFAILQPEIVAIGALLVGIGLIYDDIVAYMEGRPSFLKPVYDKMIDFANLIIEGWNFCVDTVQNLLFLLEQDFGIALEDIKNAIKFAFDVNPITLIYKALKEVYDFLLKMEEKFGALTESLKEFLKYNPTTAGFVRAYEFFGRANDEADKRDPTGELRGENPFRIRRILKPGEIESIDPSGLLGRGRPAFTQGQSLGALAAQAVTRESFNQTNDVKFSQSVTINMEDKADPKAVSEMVNKQTNAALGELARKIKSATESGSKN